MQNDNNVIPHPAKPTLRQKLLQALDKMEPVTPSTQYLNLARIVVMLLALQLMVEVASAWPI